MMLSGGRVVVYDAMSGGRVVVNFCDEGERRWWRGCDQRGCVLMSARCEVMRKEMRQRC